MKIKIFTIMLLPALLCAKSVTLSVAYEMALQNDNELRQVMYENLASEQRVKQATASLLPTINAQVSYNGERYTRKSNSSKRKIDESFYKYGIELSQSIFRPTLWYQREQEKIRAEGSYIVYENTKQELAKKVAEAYFNYAYAKEALGLANAYKDFNQARYDQMQKSLKLGLVNKMDMLESKVRLDESILEVNKAKRQISISKIALTKLVGKDIEIQSNFIDIKLEYFKSVVLTNFSDVSKNLDYKQSVLATKVAQEEYSKRKSERLPTIDLSVGYHNQDYIENDSFPDENEKLETMVRVSMPIFTSGLSSARIEEGQLLNLASIEREKNVQKDIAIKHEKAINDFVSLIDKFHIMKNSVTHAQTYEDSIQRGFEEGLKDVVDLFDAKFRSFKTKNELLSTSYDLIMSYLDLHWLVGNISLSVMQDLDRAFQ